MLCITFGIPPVIIKKDEMIIEDYFTPARKIMNSSLMKCILHYDKDSLNEKTIDKLKETIDKEEFNLEKLRKISKAS